MAHSHAVVRIDHESPISERALSIVPPCPLPSWRGVSRSMMAGKKRHVSTVNVSISGRRVANKRSQFSQAGTRSV